MLLLAPAAHSTCSKCWGAMLLGFRHKYMHIKTHLCKHSVLLLLLLLLLLEAHTWALSIDQAALAV
jgi:hypothetical protein